MTQKQIKRIIHLRSQIAFINGYRYDKWYPSFFTIAVGPDGFTLLCIVNRQEQLALWWRFNKCVRRLFLACWMSHTPMKKHERLEIRFLHYSPTIGSCSMRHPCVSSNHTLFISTPPSGSMTHTCIISLQQRREVSLYQNPIHNTRFQDLFFLLQHDYSYVPFEPLDMAFNEGHSCYKRSLKGFIKQSAIASFWLAEHSWLLDLFAFELWAKRKLRRCPPSFNFSHPLLPISPLLLLHSLFWIPFTHLHNVP